MAPKKADGHSPLRRESADFEHQVRACDAGLIREPLEPQTQRHRQPIRNQERSSSERLAKGRVFRAHADRMGRCGDDVMRFGPSREFEDPLRCLFHRDRVHPRPHNFTTGEISKDRLVRAHSFRIIAFWREIRTPPAGRKRPDAGRRSSVFGTIY